MIGVISDLKIVLIKVEYIEFGVRAKKKLDLSCAKISFAHSGCVKISTRENNVKGRCAKINPRENKCFSRAEGARKFVRAKISTNKVYEINFKATRELHKMPRGN